MRLTLNAQTKYKLERIADNYNTTVAVIAKLAIEEWLEQNWTPSRQALETLQEEEAAEI